MTAEPYTTKNGSQRFRPVLTDSEASAPQFEDGGFCIACGQEIEPIEPDARRVRCEACGEPLVFGLQELLMLDVLKIVDDPPRPRRRKAQP
jgi:hypothetical protein